jgi:four helix bundle protein
MQDFKNIEVWKKAHKLVLDIYQYTISFPSSELYGITSQIRRAAVSIPTNIAEGSAKGSNADFGRYLQIAFGSASEVEYLLLLSFELKFINEESYTVLLNQIIEIKKMLSGFIKKLKAVN